MVRTLAVLWLCCAAARAQSSREMADLNWMEFREVVPAKVRTVLLPTGTVEAHGAAIDGADVTAPVIQRWRQAVARIPDAPVGCFRVADHSGAKASFTLVAVLIADVSPLTLSDTP
ncbi:MAG: hypothetical protein HY822_11775 [Acidobacteria bacterium]|nr:hypothetical protein [Acidobacteriota bacterium]